MKKLPAPENIPLRWELWRGFGKGETIRTAIITLSVLILCVIVCVVTGAENAKVASVAVVLLTLFACAGFFGRLDQNQSIYEYLKRRRRYRAEQQIFRYRQKDEVILFVMDAEEAER